MTSETPKSNRKVNLQVIVDYLDTIALFFAAFGFALYSIVEYFKSDLIDNKFLTLPAIIAIISAILFSYKWVQKQVLNGMTQNIIDLIDKRFDQQDKKFEEFKGELKEFGKNLNKLSVDVSHLRGRYEREEKDSTTKPKTD
jgi:hypothetical protein